MNNKYIKKIVEIFCYAFLGLCAFLQLMVLYKYFEIQDAKDAGATAVAIVNQDGRRD